MAPDRHNNVFQMALEWVNQSNRNIFLTGKAGTGKTTFLRHIRDHSLKQTAVVAPTGVAAINAGGTTIHSFFQLPFSPFLPESAGHHEGATNRHTLLGKIKLNRDRIKVLQQLELLIIDEISMVRCDVLDAIDAVLRHFRHKHAEPFGGVQLLLIGDMYQLPPVTVEQERQLLSGSYNSPYFFDSRVMQQYPPVYLEFRKIYRQSDGRFIELLNQVRNNALTTAGLAMLEGLYQPAFRPDESDDHIILTTHNHKADKINAEALSKLPTARHQFFAKIEGEFSEKAYPADELLQLKEGARVMFIKNDKEKVRRYYNGKIGTVTRIEGDDIYVQCGDEEEIEVQKESWENIRYSVDPANNQLEENVIGSFSQYPLRLAWAITIHKSQGLTFEKAVIDAGAAFASGQVYVALSRCTSLSGIILQSRITTNSLRTDETIARFSTNQQDNEQLLAQLRESKKAYQQGLLLELFDCVILARHINSVEKVITEAGKDFNESTPAWKSELQQQVLELADVAAKFRQHLQTHFAQPVLPEENPALQARLKDAAKFFLQRLADVREKLLACPAVTDSREQARKFNDSLKDLFVAVAEKIHLLKAITDGFTLAGFYETRKIFAVPPFTFNAYATAAAESRVESPHPELHHQLRMQRNRFCDDTGLPVYMVANSKTIDEMASCLPQTEDELAMISGFGKAKVSRYGKAFLRIIREYSEAHGLSSAMEAKKTVKPKKSSRQAKGDSMQQSFRLFREGKSVAEIAAERNLSTTTIEGHLADFVRTGEIGISALLEKEKLEFIAPFLHDYVEGSPLTPVMTRLENKVSYSELRLAVAAHLWETKGSVADLNTTTIISED